MRRLKQEALSTQITTSDEAPRERLNDVLTDAYERRFERQAERNMFMFDELPPAPTVEAVDALLADAIATGMGVMVGGQHVPIEQVKVSSPDLAALAAKYVGMTDNEMWIAITGKRELRYESDEGPVICSDIRSLAASVLSQAEAK